MTDPPASQVEDENLEAATTTNEANVEPSPAKASEDSEATDPATSVPESAADPQFDYHVEHRPQVQKPIPRLPRFPGPASAPGSFNINGFRVDNTFFDSSRNPYSRERISSDRFWSYPQRSYYSCILYNQGRIFPHKRLDIEAIAGLPCLEEALDCFKEVGLLPFVTDQEHWNEELLLHFYATLYIRGYSRDPKTWVLEWMTGNVHHEAKAFDIIELTGLPTPGDLYEHGCQLHSEAIESIFQKTEPNMSQMLSMMKPLPQDATYATEFFVEDLEYLPRTIYHIIRRTLWPIKGHSPHAKLEGAMKTLVFYILHGKCFNT